MKQAEGISKYYSVFEIINGIPQKTPCTYNIYFYTEPEAEVYISKRIAENPKAVFAVFPTYIVKRGDDSEMKNRIKNSYTPLD